MDLIGVSSLIYGLLVLLGGIAGFAAAGSMASLFAGIVFGGLVLAGSWGLYLQKNWGFPLVFITVFVLMVFFIYRFVLTMKAMPAGFMLLLSLILISILLRKFR